MASCTSPRHVHRALGSILLALLFCTTPEMASAERFGTDRVAGTTLAEASPEVRQASPDLDLPAGLLSTMDGKVLWARSDDERRPMASTTKIMTCMLVLEAADVSDEVVVSSRAAAVGGSGVYLWAGERLSVRDLLYALMLESSNAAATVLAEHVAGSESAFVARMNERAMEMGLADTSFKNPHGLDADGHHASASDLVVLAREAMQDDVFRDLVRTWEIEIPGNGAPRQLENSNLLIDSYEGATGVKTGWTTPAGYCVVASARRDDVELIAVVLGSDDEDIRFEEAARLLDWGFSHYGPVTLTSAEDTVAMVSVSDYLDRWVVAEVGENAQAHLLDLEGDVYREYEIVAAVEAPVEAGQLLGTLRVFQGDVLIAEVPVVARDHIPEPTFWERLTIFFTRIWRSWFGEPGAVPVGV